MKRNTQHTKCLIFVKLKRIAIKRSEQDENEDDEKEANSELI